MSNVSPALVLSILCGVALLSIILFLLVKNNNKKRKEDSLPTESSYTRNIDILYDLEHLNKSESCKKSFLLDKIAEIIFNTRQKSLTKEQKNFADSLILYLVNPAKSRALTINVEGSLDHLHSVCMQALKDSLKVQDLNFEISPNLDSITYTCTSLELPEAIQIYLDDYLLASKKLKDYLEEVKKEIP